MLNGITPNINPEQVAAFSKSFGALFIYLIVYLIWCYVGMRLFKKAGKNAMSAFIPFLNIWEFFEILYGKGKGWICIFIVIPPVSYIMHFVVHVAMAKAFGKKELFGVFTALFPFFVSFVSLILFFIFPPFAFLTFFVIPIVLFLPIFPAYYAFNSNIKYVGPLKENNDQSESKKYESNKKYYEKK